MSMYSKTLRYVASRSVDLADTWFWIGSKDLWGMQILHSFLLILPKFFRFFKDFSRIFWGFLTTCNVVSRCLVFLGTKNCITRGLAVILIHSITKLMLAKSPFVFKTVFLNKVLSRNLYPADISWSTLLWIKWRS